MKAQLRGFYEGCRRTASDTSKRRHGRIHINYWNVCGQVLSEMLIRQLDAVVAVRRAEDDQAVPAIGRRVSSTITPSRPRSCHKS
jgi:hypothetical protein